MKIFCYFFGARRSMSIRLRMEITRNGLFRWRSPWNSFGIQHFAGGFPSPLISGWVSFLKESDFYFATVYVTGMPLYLRDAHCYLQYVERGDRQPLLQRSQLIFYYYSHWGQPGRNSTLLCNKLSSGCISPITFILPPYSLSPPIILLNYKAVKVSCQP